MEIEQVCPPPSGVDSSMLAGADSELLTLILAADARANAMTATVHRMPTAMALQPPTDPDSAAPLRARHGARCGELGETSNLIENPNFHASCLTLGAVGITIKPQGAKACAYAHRCDASCTHIGVFPSSLAECQVAASGQSSSLLLSSELSVAWFSSRPSRLQLLSRSGGSRGAREASVMMTSRIHADLVAAGLPAWLDGRFWQQFITS